MWRARCDVAAYSFCSGFLPLPRWLLHALCFTRILLPLFKVASDWVHMPPLWLSTLVPRLVTILLSSQIHSGNWWTQDSLRAFHSLMLNLCIQGRDKFSQTRAKGWWGVDPAARWVSTVDATEDQCYWERGEWKLVTISGFGFTSVALAMASSLNLPKGIGMFEEYQICSPLIDLGPWIQCTSDVL